MGWFVFLVKNVILWLDRMSERSLLKVVPDLDAVLFDPSAALAHREIVIGPARRYASGLALGLVTAFFGWCVALVLFALAFDFNRLPPGQRAQAGFVFLILCGVLLAASLLFMMYQVRGGQMVLSERGVELRYRGTVVFCPWALFNTPGQPFPPGRDRVVLPVVPSALSWVEARRHGRLLAAGMRVRTRQWRFRSASEAVLRAFYEVNALHLAKVLLHLGRILGTASPQVQPSALEFPLTELAEDEPARLGSTGWVTVSLTRLAFPPLCCNCGAATAGRQKFRVAEPLFGFSRLWHPTRSEAVYVWVPVCYACQTAGNHRRRRAVWNGLWLGLLLIFLSAVSMCLWPANPVVTLAFILAVLLAPLLGALIGYHVSKERSLPVEMRNYLPEKGTIMLRFRRPEYTEQMLQALQTRAET